MTKIKYISLFVIILASISPLSSYANSASSTISTSTIPSIVNSFINKNKFVKPVKTKVEKGNNIERQKERAIKTIDRDIQKLTKDKKQTENAKHIESLKEIKIKISSAKDAKEIQKLIKKARDDGREERKAKNLVKKAEVVKPKKINTPN